MPRSLHSWSSCLEGNVRLQSKLNRYGPWKFIQHDFLETNTHVYRLFIICEKCILFQSVDSIGKIGFAYFLKRVSIQNQLTKKYQN